MKWLFWEVDFRKLEDARDVHHLLARVLQHGKLEDIQWVTRRDGLPRIHRFFREVGHPEVTERTRAFWRAVLHA